LQLLGYVAFVVPHHVNLLLLQQLQQHQVMLLRLQVVAMTRKLLSGGHFLRLLLCLLLLPLPLPLNDIFVFHTLSQLLWQQLLLLLLLGVLALLQVYQQPWAHLQAWTPMPLSLQQYRQRHGAMTRGQQHYKAALVLLQQTLHLVPH
jgi:hypothetical protein